MDNRLAICVGLWLAEGDNKTKSEITFTNNCFELIEFFHEVMVSTFPNIRPRLYCYSKNGVSNFYINDIPIKNYIDIRARKPYGVYRFASVDYVRQWKDLVSYVISSNIFNSELLQGFFAGEGNIRDSSRSKIFRIAQKDRLIWLEQKFNYFSLTYNFRKKDRSYNFHVKYNWDIFSKFKLADLHPLKKKSFWSVYYSFKETHYSPGYLKKIFLDLLSEKRTTKELSVIVGRSPDRVYDVLSELKKEGNVINFRKGRVSYWVLLKYYNGNI